MNEVCKFAQFGKDFGHAKLYMIHITAVKKF